MNEKEQLIIPNKIKVGFQKRSDTYTGKLAYVVYVDNKGITRKENSWEGWRSKDINPEEFINEPTTGFVLNKDVGGSHRSYSWNARREKVRVYDPRNFEFEITIENLLFVLQECSSIKGKGLEGEFVYSWSGSELVLLPVCSKEYKESMNFTKLQVEKVSAKDIKEGHTYLTKKQEEVMYLGKFTWWDNISNYHKRIYGKKKHVFINLENIGKTDYSFLLLDGFSSIAKKTSDTCLPEFAEEFDKLNKSQYVSKPIKMFFSKEPIVYNKDKYDWGHGVGIEHNGKIYTGYCNANNPWAEIKTFVVQITDSITLTSEGNVIIKDERPKQSGYFISSYNNSYKGFGSWGLYENNMSYEELQKTVRKIMFEHENGAISCLY